VLLCWSVPCDQSTDASDSTGCSNTRTRMAPGSDVSRCSEFDLVTPFPSRAEWISEGERLVGVSRPMDPPLDEPQRLSAAVDGYCSDDRVGGADRLAEFDPI
jgi:hypothetical protein